MKILNLIFFFTITLVKADSLCVYDKILDTDGIPICPHRKSDKQGYLEDPWALMRCGYKQSKTYEEPNDNQKLNMRNYIIALKSKDPVQILDSITKTDLRVCRIKKPNDPILLSVVKPGVSDYTGGFLLFRENQDNSNLFIQTLHDTTDYTHSAPKIGFMKSKAFALLSNGAPKNIAIQKSSSDRSRKISDTPHSTQNLVWIQHKAITTLYPDSVVIHIHGMKGDGIIATNGLGASAEEGSLMRKFGSVITNVFKDKDPQFKSRLRSCSGGSGLSIQKNCKLNSAWEQVKDLSKSGRVIGFETGMNIMKNDFFINLFAGLEV